MAGALVDTGAIVAFLDRRDYRHEACVLAFQEASYPLITSEAVLTEAFYMLGPDRNDVEALWKLMRSGPILMAPIDDSELPAIHALMAQYWDCPMDFADATLVYLARRESLTTILTIDRSDFETYRIEGKRKFRILPDARQ